MQPNGKSPQGLKNAPPRVAALSFIFKWTESGLIAPTLVYLVFLPLYLALGQPGTKASVELIQADLNPYSYTVYELPQKCAYVEEDTTTQSLYPRLAASICCQSLRICFRWTLANPLLFLSMPWMSK